MRSGEMVAMAQDTLDLADALKLNTFAVVGHDWGARIAYVLAAVHPERTTRICAMSVGWQPGELPTPALEQVRKYWYQWFMATDRGSEAVRRDRKALARIQWETWAPREGEFEITAKSFENPDWPDITLHSYRVRWGEADKDPRYRDIDRRAKAAHDSGWRRWRYLGGYNRRKRETLRRWLPATRAGRSWPFSNARSARRREQAADRFP